MIPIRPEKPEDIASIDEINRLAFDGEDEVKLIKAIWGSDYRAYPPPIASQIFNRETSFGREPLLWYSTVCPNLQGCYAQGASYDEISRLHYANRREERFQNAVALIS